MTSTGPRINYEYDTNGKIRRIDEFYIRDTGAVTIQSRMLASYRIVPAPAGRSSTLVLHERGLAEEFQFSYATSKLVFYKDVSGDPTVFKKVRSGARITLERDGAGKG